MESQKLYCCESPAKHISSGLRSAVEEINCHAKLCMCSQHPYVLVCVAVIYCLSKGYDCRMPNREVEKYFCNLYSLARLEVVAKTDWLNQLKLKAL